MSGKPTIFIDIDGTLLNHLGSLTNIIKGHDKQKLLKGAIEKLNEWEQKGYNIILTTGRKKSLKGLTKQQLLKHGIFYDQLIMGLGGGARYIINDKKPDGKSSCFAINIERNKGLNDVNI